MSLPHQQIRDVVVLSPTRRIDHASADDFREAVMPWLTGCHNQADGHALVFDFAKVEYISSAGVAGVDAGLKANQACWGADRGCGAAAGRGGDLQDQPL